MKTPWRFSAANVLGPVALAALILGTGFAQDAPKKVTKTEGLNAVTTKVPPRISAHCPPIEDRRSRGTGGLVTETGVVEKVNIVSGNPVLTRPASDAVKKWKFAPFTGDGKAVKALVPVSMSFKM